MRGANSLLRILVLLLVAALFLPGAALAAPAASALAATHNLVTNISYNPPSPNILHLNQDINLTFNYQTDEPGGVRIFARPFTNGALTPNYAASGSPLYPTGAGTGGGSFTITSGGVVVDQIRFEILSADQSRLLFEGFVPVHYRFATEANDITSVALSPHTPNILANGQDVTINFNYKTTQPGGVRIFARPFTAGALTPDYAASGSPLYATGSGTGSGTFTILSGSVNVDQIRFEMLSADQSVLLYEVFVPVSYAFRAPGNIVTGVDLRPMNPNILDHGQDITIAFNYQTTEPGGVRIFARPFSHGNLSPNYAASGSPLYATGSGTGSGTITITSGPVVVDAIRFQVLSADQTSLLFETLIPVHYQFGVVTPVYLPAVWR